jgi:hypothetical protein
VPAQKHTKKADTAKKQRQWEHIRESAEARGDPPGKAIRKASGVIKKESRKSKSQSKSK